MDPTKLTAMVAARTQDWRRHRVQAVLYRHSDQVVRKQSPTCLVPAGGMLPRLSGRVGGGERSRYPRPGQQMAINGALEGLAQKWEAEAERLRQLYFVDDARRMEDMAAELRVAAMTLDSELLTPVDAEAYSRGYDRDYLRRTVENRGSRFQPLYRRADLPRHPILSRKAEHERARRQQKREA